MVDQKAAAAEFSRTQAMTAALPEPARTLMTYVNTRNVKALGPMLLPHVGGVHRGCGAVAGALDRP